MLAGILGLPVAWTPHPVVLKSVLPGIVTGLLVAIAVSISEAAPLLPAALSRRHAE
jgi:phosphate transport system permease protein